MLRTLPESARRRRMRPGVAAVSVAAHTIILALAVRASGMTAPPNEAPREEPVVWTETRPTPAPMAPVSASRRTDPTEGPTDAALRLPSVPVPTTIPDGVPTEMGLERLTIGAGLVDSLLSAAGGTPTGGGTPASPGAGTAPFEEHTVERAIVPLPNSPLPRYPEILRSSGVEGTVLVRFIVDTTGRVERGSVRALAFDHRLFVDAVERALAGTRFQPAEAGGRKVRQLAERQFQFRMNR